jgi:bifunctional non-homologous end joining protein LigD
MLPALVPVPPEGRAGESWLFEVKLDGVRALAWKEGERVKLVSRAGNALEGAFPELSRAIARLPVERCVLDGEVCRHDEEGRTRFQLLQPRIQLSSARASERLAREQPATFYVFDAPFVLGLDLRAVPLERRKEVARALLPEDDERLRWVDHTKDHGRELLALVCEKELEGVVAKRAGSTYVSGRTSLWVKVKCGTVGAFVIGGAALYRTTARGSIGSLLLGLYSREGELVPVGAVGTGFDEKTRRALRGKVDALAQERSPFAAPLARMGPRSERTIWARPELVCECRYAELTREGKLRAPSFLGVVEGDPKRCTLPSERRKTDGHGLGLGHGQGNERPRITNRDKVFFPEDGITKGDLADYYEMVAPLLLPHLEDRPMVLVRYPDGITGGAFYQKNAGLELPAWARTHRIYSHESRRWVRYLVVDRLGELLHCVQLGAISLSPWSSRVGSLENPDFAILDLDPGEDCSFETVIEVARLVHAILEEVGLRGYPKTSGATGMHVVVPLAPGYRYEDARTLAEIVARLALARRPDLVTLVRSLAKRPRDKLYLDYLQNVVGKTVVSVYSIRERKKAPVSTPLHWPEVRRGLTPEKFHLRNVAARLARVGDLWRPALEDRQRIEPALAKLASFAGARIGRRKTA